MKFTKWQYIALAILLAGFLLAYFDLKPVSSQMQVYSLWSSVSDSTFSPAIPADTDTQSVELGVKFGSNVPGKITAIRFYRGVPIDSGYPVHLWDDLGNLLGNAISIEGQQPTPGWQIVQLYPPVSIDALKTYIASYYANGGQYSVNENFFQPKEGTDFALEDSSLSVSDSPLYALCNRSLINDEYKCNNGVYKYGLSSFPTESYKSSNYWVDVIFQPD